MRRILTLVSVLAIASIPLLARNFQDQAESYSSSVELYQQADEKYKNGQYREALQLLSRALDKNPAYSKAHLLSGMAAINLSDFERAMLHFNQVLQSDPSNLEARIGKGRALTGLGQLDGAEAIFEEVRKSDPGNTDNLYGMARLRMLRGRTDLARQYLELILRKDPAYRLALQDMAVLETAAGHLESGKDYLRRATAVDPSHTSVSVTRGRVLALESEQVRSVEESLRLKDEAADALRTSLEESPDLSIYQALIRLDIERGYPEEGLEILEEARQLDSNNQNLMRLSANLSQAMYQKSGERRYLDAAMDSLRRLCEDSPSDVLACYRLQMLALDNTGTSAVRSYLTDRHLQLAARYEKDLRYGLRVSHLRQALELSPGHAGLESKLLEIYRADGNFDSYLSTLVSLRDRHPEEPLWQYRVERAMQARGNYLSYREELNGLQPGMNNSSRRPSVVLVLDFLSRDGSHWNGEQVVGRAIADAINDSGKLESAPDGVRQRIREFAYSLDSLEQSEYSDRFAADYRPLLFDASYFGYLDELDRNGSARNRIRYIVSGTFTAGEGNITIEYSLRDRFTGKELYSGKSTATGEDALHRAALQVAERIERLTPVRGEVVKVNDGFVYIHAGKRDGLKKGQVFILENDPSKEFQVVELDTSFAALKPGKDVPLISAGMVLLSNPRMLR